MPAPAKPQQIMLVCGLGNPGDEYEHTRHNIGFATVDVIAAREGVRYWKSEGGAATATIVRGGRTVLLAKPQAYMNTSGGPLSKVMRAHKLAPQQVLVIHDEVDLPQGQVRAKFGGGLNGHNGLRSIADKLGTRDFCRLRCGIGRPPGKMQVADYVLRTLKGNFLQDFELEAQDAADLVEAILDKGIEGFLAE